MESRASRIGLITAVALAVVAGTAHSTVWTVGYGPEYFTDRIQTALDVASDGDLVLVHEGWYPGSPGSRNVHVPDKEISIVAAPGAEVTTLLFQIGPLSTGKVVVLAGFWLLSTGFDPLRAATLEARDLEGSLRLQNLGFGSYDGGGLEAAAFLNCRDVAIVRSSLGGGSGVRSRNALTAQDSRVALYDGPLGGGTGADGGRVCIPYGLVIACLGQPGGVGGDGAQVDGFFFASGCAISGGRGGRGGFSFIANHVGPEPPYWPGGNGGIGGHGLVTSAQPPSALLDCVVTGGAGGPGGDGSPPGMEGLPGEPIVGVIDQLPGESCRLSCPNVAFEFTSVPVTVSGEPGNGVTLIGSARPAFEFSAEQRGVLLVAAPLLFETFLGTIDGSGTLTTQLAIPDLGAEVENATWHLQARIEDAAGQETLSGPAALMILDDQYRTGVSEQEEASPTARLALEPIYPNPFRGGTQVRYALGHSGPVRLAIHSVQGRHVRTLVDAVQSSGGHTVLWDGYDGTGRPCGTGIYFARLRFGGEEQRAKLVRLE